MSRWVVLLVLALVMAIIALIRLDYFKRGPDCDERFDAAEWRQADFGSTRRVELAEHVVECETVQRMGRRNVERLLGREHVTSDQYSGEPGVANARYGVQTVNDAIGPGDDQSLVVYYDRRKRVVTTELSPPGD